MSALALKAIAVLTMLIDHIGASLITYSGQPWLYVTLGNGRVNLLRFVGRLAFPIFAFLIAQGAVKTSNWRKYAVRLVIFGLLSELPFDLLFYGKYVEWAHQNVYLTLFLGMAVIEADRMIKRSALNRSDTAGLILRGNGQPGAGGFSAAGFALAMAAGWLAQCFHTDYGMYGVAMIYVCYVFYKQKALAALSIILINLYMGSGGSTVQMFAGLAALPILCYNWKPGLKSKALQYGFYAFYPVHLLVLYLIVLLK